jgi:hypothetical protein
MEWSIENGGEKEEVTHSPMYITLYTHNQYTSQKAHIILFSIRAVCVCGDLCVNAECAVLNRAAAGRSRFYRRVPFSCLSREMRARQHAERR